NKALIASLIEHAEFLDKRSTSDLASSALNARQIGSHERSYGHRISRTCAQPSMTYGRSALLWKLVDTTWITTRGSAPVRPRTSVSMSRHSSQSDSARRVSPIPPRSLVGINPSG